jgi:hypothetical protein
MALRSLSILLVLAVALMPQGAGAEDVVSRLLKDTVATFSDSYDLLYYSLKSALSRDLREQARSVQVTREITSERIEAYLEAKGILVRRDSQPITRKDFARILIERFDLPKGFFTRLTGSSSWYFRDAVRAGLFADTDASDGTMSTREMLSVFTRAEQLSRAR